MIAYYLQRDFMHKYLRYIVLITKRLLNTKGGNKLPNFSFRLN